MATEFRVDITPGAPPLLWSNMYEALDQINYNFESLAAAIGDGSGLVPINFETLNTSVSPAVTTTYQLGDQTHQWKSLFTSGYSTNPGSELNGVWLGNAHVKGILSTVELPFGSTVAGELIKDPTRVFFKEIQVDNDLSIVAIEGTNSFGLNSGNGVSLSVDSSSETITFNNEGVTSIIPNTGISVSSASGDVTVTNTGVTSLTNTTALPSGRTAGAGINVSGSTGNIALTNTGVLSIEPGSAALIVSTDAATGIVTITNAAPAGNAFRYAVVNGLVGSPIEANSVNGILNFVAGQGITLSQSTVTDTITFTINPEFDLTGSVFSDGSTKLVDGVEGKIVGDIETNRLRTFDLEIALGNNTGSNQGLRAVAVGADSGAVDQGIRAVAIGNQAGQFRQSPRSVAMGASAAYFEQGDSAVAIGDNAGQSSQGDYAIAVGYYAGHNNQSANSIILNASGSILNGAAAGFYVNPIRSTATATGPVMYNPTTKEMFYNTVLEFAGSTISTNDSSGLTVDVQTTFNSDVNIENELRVRGSLMISVTQLKSIAAASTDFAAFKTAIAAL